MRLNDFDDIFRAHPAVPDRFRVHHDRGSVLALIQTAGAVRTDLGLQISRGKLFFKLKLQSSQSAWVATSAWIVGRSLIGAYENMMRKFRHRIDRASRQASRRPERSPCLRSPRAPCQMDDLIKTAPLGSFQAFETFKVSSDSGCWNGLDFTSSCQLLQGNRETISMVD